VVGLVAVLDPLVDGEVIGCLVEAIGEANPCNPTDFGEVESKCTGISEIH
jgi:hypothetical protein